MENMEEILMELNSFEKATPTPDKLTPVLEQYLITVAKTGDTHFPWSKIKPVFRVKLNNVIEEFCVASPAADVPPVPNVDAFSFPDCKEKVFQQLDYFSGVPFTVQRLCELLTLPQKHYKRTDKFMRALEKTMLVVSTVDPVRRDTAAPEDHRLSTENGDEVAGPSTDLMNGDHRSSDEEDAEDESPQKHDPSGEKEKDLASASCGEVAQGGSSNETKDNGNVQNEAASALSEEKMDSDESQLEHSKESSVASTTSEEQLAHSESADKNGALTPPLPATSQDSSDQLVDPRSEETADSDKALPQTKDKSDAGLESANSSAPAVPQSDQDEAVNDTAEGETPMKKLKLADLEQGEESGLSESPEK